MKRLIKFAILITAVILSLTSCDMSANSSQSVEQLNKMKCPIIIVASSPQVIDENNDLTIYGSVMVCDANKNFKTFTSNYPCGAALLATYEVGDTIKM